jgi:hypothetical protein
MLVPGVDPDAFLTGLGFGLAIVFMAWVPLAGIGLIRRLLGMS